jgi:hypothetical protein
MSTSQELSSIVETIQQKQAVVKQKIEALQVEHKALEAAARVLAGVDNLEVVLDALDAEEEAPSEVVAEPVRRKRKARKPRTRTTMISLQEKEQIFFGYVAQQQRVGLSAEQRHFAKQQADAEGSGQKGFYFWQKTASQAAIRLIQQQKIKEIPAPTGSRASKAYALVNDPFTYRPAS